MGNSCCCYTIPLSAVNNAPKFSLEGHTYYGRVVYIVDGDTFDIVIDYHGKYTKFRIRLLGINAPEMKPKKCIPESEREAIHEAALVSKKALEILIYDRMVKIECGKFDNFGRLLATVYMNKLNINDYMLEHGYANVYKKG